MKVKVLNLEDGLKLINDVKIVRIKSKDYNLLIMKDHLPIIGEIIGSVEIISSTETINYTDIEGYYINESNIFKLVLKEE